MTPYAMRDPGELRRQSLLDTAAHFERLRQLPSATAEGRVAGLLKRVAHVIHAIGIGIGNQLRTSQMLTLTAIPAPTVVDGLCASMNEHGDGYRPTRHHPRAGSGELPLWPLAPARKRVDRFPRTVLGPGGIAAHRPASSQKRPEVTAEDAWSGGPAKDADPSDAPPSSDTQLGR